MKNCLMYCLLFFVIGFCSQMTVVGQSGRLNAYEKAKADDKSEGQFVTKTIDQGYRFKVTFRIDKNLPYDSMSDDEVEIRFKELFTKPVGDAIDECNKFLCTLIEITVIAQKVTKNEITTSRSVDDEKKVRTLNVTIAVPISTPPPQDVSPPKSQKLSTEDKKSD